MIDKDFPLYVIVFLVGFILTSLLTKALIPILKKKAEQPIYTDGPSWHSSKSGTPTMGGLGFLVSISITLLLSSLYLFMNNQKNEGISVLLCLAYSLLNALVGVIDDVTKLKKKKNAGLTPKEKLLFQFGISIAFLIARGVLLPNSSVTTFSFGTFDFGIFYYPITLLILVGITNFANLTDGIDGLASSVAFAASVSFFYISCALAYESAIISSSVMGAALGFLIFNIYPAKIFMGDTGSLLFGSILSAIAVTLNNPLLILFIGGIYVVEGASVIMQVVYYKFTGKRIFKMAPLHHHLEKCGWSEIKICLVAILISFILALPAYVFYMP